MIFADLLQRALSDREFKKRLVIDPEGALREIGVQPTAEKIRALKDAGLAILAAEIAFDDSTIDNV